MRHYFFKIFWDWYERHYLLNITIAGGLFLLQIVHLAWLTSEVVVQRLLGISYFSTTPLVETMLVLVDYTEIPALIGVSLIYGNELRTGWRWMSVLFLLMLNSQWLHIFWITDEVVVEKLTGQGVGTVLPVWIAWAAILIDYLELPAMADTVRSFFLSLKQRRTGAFIRQEFTAQDGKIRRQPNIETRYIDIKAL